MPQFPKPKLPNLPRIRSNEVDDSPLDRTPASNEEGGDDSTNAASSSVVPVASPAAVNDERKVFYINITVHDASAVIRQKVTQKVSQKQASLPGPQSFKDKVAKSVGKKAGERVPPSKVAEMMAAKMPKALPIKMKQKGLTVAVEEVFREGPYFVLQVQVRHVDMAMMVEQSQKDSKDKKEESSDDESVSSKDWESFLETQRRAEEENSQSNNAMMCLNTTYEYREGLAGYVEWFLRLIGINFRNHLEREYLPAMIQKKMSMTMGEMLRRKYDSKNIKAEAKTLPEEKQARYFYANLKKVRLMKANARSRTRSADKLPQPTSSSSANEN